MPAVTSTSSQNLLSRVTWCALTVLLLTTAHHVYGAYVYHTPWRLHVAFISGVAATAIISSVLVLRRHADDVLDHLAFWAFVAVTLVFPVAAIGLIEGAYNHVLKDVLYLGGASTSLMIRMFPPPAYELPNNAFFEITGVLQAVPASVTGWLLYRLVRSRWDASHRLNVGDAIARRALSSVSGEPVSVPDQHRLVHLQFRRFAGCPVCNLHLQSFSRREKEITAEGIREIVVFHSTADDLRAYTVDLPFAVIADPDKRLYLEFGVESSPRALLDPHAWPAILRGIIHSVLSILRHNQPVPSLRPPGGRLGLPADFLIAPDGRVLACKYGAHADDQWSAEEVVSRARDAHGHNNGWSFSSNQPPAASQRSSESVVNSQQQSPGPSLGCQRGNH